MFYYGNKKKKDIKNYIKGKLILIRFINHFIINLLNIIRKEIKNKIQLLFLILNLPYKFKRIFSLVAQNYTGDVTVYPDPSINDYLNILIIPNKI